MMQIRCQNCAWAFELDRDALARAVVEAQAKNRPHHLLACPQCGHVTQIDVEALRQNLPPDYPLPEVATSAPALAKLITPESELKWNIAVVPILDPQKQRAKTQTRFQALVWAVVVMWILTLFWWLMADVQNVAASPLPAGAEMALVLAPVLAAAASVERFLETIFGIIEQRWLALVAYLGRGQRWLYSAETEVQQARKWLADVSHEANKVLADLPISPEQFEMIVPDQMDQGQTVDQLQALVMDEAQKKLATALQMMRIAEDRLSNAERELAAGVQSSAYRDAKRTASIILGLWLGLVIATAGQMQMFAMLGVGIVPAKFDVLVTGLVIGSGSYPVHSLVGLLQEAKNALDSTQGFLKDKSALARKALEG